MIRGPGGGGGCGGECGDKGGWMRTGRGLCRGHCGTAERSEVCEEFGRWLGLGAGFGGAPSILFQSIPFVFTL